MHLESSSGGLFLRGRGLTMHIPTHGCLILSFLKCLARRMLFSWQRMYPFHVGILNRSTEAYMEEVNTTDHFAREDERS